MKYKIVKGIVIGKVTMVKIPMDIKNKTYSINLK